MSMDWANSTLEFSLNIHEYQSAGAGADNRFLVVSNLQCKENKQIKTFPLFPAERGKSEREKKH